MVHSLSAPLNPTAQQPDLNAGPFSYSSPPTAPKLSKSLETQLKEVNIDLITNDRVSIPAGPSDDSSAWDGSFGLQNGLKRVKLDSGKTLDADFVFISTGNKPNVSMVESKDPGAIAQGLIAVDEYLKVSRRLVGARPLTYRSCQSPKTRYSPRATMLSAIAPRHRDGRLLKALNSRLSALLPSEFGYAGWLD